MLAPGDQKDTRPDGAKRRRANLVIALALFAFVVFVFIITMARLGGHVFDMNGM